MGYDPRDYIYDLECYPNVFTASFLHAATLQRFKFEISPLRNDAVGLMMFLNGLQKESARMFGFFNIMYDYPLLHYIINYNITNGTINALTIFTESDRIINTSWNDRYKNLIWESDHYIEQGDLAKIHHFDRVKKAGDNSQNVSLKSLEFMMRLDNVKTLPYEPGTTLSPPQIFNLIVYNDFDVDATFGFYKESLEDIEMREELSELYEKSFLNLSESSIGAQMMVNELGIDLCFNWDSGKREPNQTVRESLHLFEVIFPYIHFNNPEFNRIKNWLSSQTITETKGVFEDLTCEVDNVTFKFGLGGLHASVKGSTYTSDDEWVIVDDDVDGYYPSLMIKNGLHPEHLGDAFNEAQEVLKENRAQYPKGTHLNYAWKLAGNSNFGNTNSKYSSNLDIKCFMGTTINGQLLLCMYVEWLLSIPGLKIIQANTDGITYRCRRSWLPRVEEIKKAWESFTLLKMSTEYYNRMFIMNVNNYLAEFQDGSLKNKGAFLYDRGWDKDHSMMVVPRAVEAHLIHGVDVRKFIINHADKFDFMLLAKAPKKSHLLLGDETIQPTSRYYVTTVGDYLHVISPPKGVPGHFKKSPKSSKDDYENWDNSIWNENIHTKNKSTHVTRQTAIQSGWLITECNDMKTYDRNVINYEYYIAEAMKLIDGVS